MPLEATLLLVVPFAVVGGALLIVCVERLGWIRRHESRLTRLLRRTGLIVSCLVTAEMATLWAYWAGDVNEAPFAMWGALLAASALVLVALKPSPLRAAIGVVLALIPPAFFWLMLTIASECHRAGCSWAQKLSGVPVAVLVVLAAVLSLLELGRVTRQLLAQDRRDGQRPNRRTAAH